MEAGPSSLPDIRAEILRKLEERDVRLKPLGRMFSNYSSMATEMNKRSRTISVDAGSGPSSVLLQELKEELSTLYKQKSINDQNLIDANRKLAESERSLAKVTETLEKTKQDRDRMCGRIAELEHALKKMTDDKNDLYDEWVALSAIVKSQEQKVLIMEGEHLQLLNKIRELNEQKASNMNDELAQQAARQQRRIQEEIQKAVAEISVKDDRSNSSTSILSGPQGNVMLGDAVPTYAQSKFDSNDGEVLDLLWLSAETFATAGSDRKTRIWKVETNGKQTKTGTLTGCNQAITRLDFDNESRSLLASSNDNGVRLWNIDTLRLMSTFNGHTDKVNVARFHQTHQLVSGGSDRSIKIWDLPSQRCARTFFPGSTIHDMIGTCPMGGAAFISGHFDKKIRMWDGRTNEPVQIMEMAGKVTSLFMAADGLHLLCSTRDDTLSLMDVRTLRTLHIYSAEQFHTSSDFSRCVLSPGMDYCASGSSNGNVFVWNVQTTRLEKCLAKGGNTHPVLSVNWNPSGRGILSADRQKTVVLWA